MNEQSQPLNPNDTVIYHESPIPGGPKVLIIGALIGVLGIVAAVAADAPIIGVPAIMVTFFSIVLLISLTRYHTIDLDRTQLRVGPHRIDLDDIDASFGARHGAEVLDDATRAGLEIGMGSKRGDVRIFGGAWGRPMNGSSWVVFQNRAGQFHVVASRNAARFVAALSGALSHR